MSVSKNVIVFFVLFSFLFTLDCDSSSPIQDGNESVLYVPMTSKIRGMDPGDIGDYPTSKVVGQFYECLYQYHFLKRPYEIIPMLAEEMPKISQDGLTYTVKIKKNVYFHNDKCFAEGKIRELKANDFVFAWKRIADIKTLSRNWWIFDNKIEGLNEFREYTKTCKSRENVDYNHPVEGLQTPDDYTLVIKLKKPWPQLIYYLAHLPTAPIAKEAIDLYGKNITSHPVGTGPFKLKLWNRGSYLVMVKNETYRQEFYPDQGEESDIENGFLQDSGKLLPLTDKIVWVLIEESQPCWLQFMRGKLDAMSIPKDNFAQVITVSKELTPQMKQRNIKLKTFRDPSTFWIGFNMENKLLGKNKPLRQALSYSIDRQKYIDLFWNGRDEIAYGPIPPIMKAYNPNIKELGINYNPQKAKVLAKEAEKIYGGQLPVLKLSMPGTDSLSRQMGQFCQKCFTEAGLNIEVEYLDWPTFLQKVKTKSTQMFSMGWIADYPDSETFLQTFYTKNISPGSNSFNYSNSVFDKIYEQFAVMQDSPKRTELYREAEKIIIKDCPAVFINHRVAYILHHEWVKNYKPHVFQYGLAKYHKIDMQERAKYKELLKRIK